MKKTLCKWCSKQKHGYEIPKEMIQKNPPENVLGVIHLPKKKSNYTLWKLSSNGTWPNNTAIPGIQCYLSPWTSGGPPGRWKGLLLSGSFLTLFSSSAVSSDPKFNLGPNHDYTSWHFLLWICLQFKRLNQHIFGGSISI